MADATNKPSPGSHPPGSRPVIVNGEVKWIAPGTRVKSVEFDDLGGGQAVGGDALLWTNFLKRNGKNVALLVLSVGLMFAVKRVELQALVFLLSILVAIGLNLGQRRAGELSAYSMFNPGYKSLAGDLRAEHFEAQIRGGPVPVRPQDDADKGGRVLGGGPRGGAAGAHEE